MSGRLFAAIYLGSQFLAPDFDTVIDETPHLLLRDDLCKAASDPKYTVGVPPIYIPAADYERVYGLLSDPAVARPFDIREIASFYGIDARHGLLYLPYPYLVPGGRFNSMYGWDTAFPVFAWADEHPKIMREQVDNQLYQVRMYGKVLNANRTYHLSRSQPPLIAAMTLRVFHAMQDKDWRVADPDGIYRDAAEWLAMALPALQAQHTYWTSEQRLAGDTGLSRYWDEGNVPAPEVIVGEAGHFDHALAHFADAKGNAGMFLDKDGGLSSLYYRADRAMRASGFDPTGHWGYGALNCVFHAPVCLNALLYKMEGDIGEICDILSRPDEAAAWKELRDKRRAAMQQYLYNPDTCVYEDYDFTNGSRNAKPFASSFHAFWAGLYDGDNNAAAKAASALLGTLETPYGIVTSEERSGSQWDYPYGWPPLQYFAMEGLRRCGQETAAKRLARKYQTLAMKVFDSRGTLFEKYNMEEGNAEIHVVHGYDENTNENGTFLWTAATLKMVRDLLKE